MTSPDVLKLAFRRIGILFRSLNIAQMKVAIALLEDDRAERSKKVKELVDDAVALNDEIAKAIDDLESIL